MRNFDAWTSAYVVRADTAIALKEWLWNESANATKPISQHLMPEGRSADAFLGERFWSSAYRYFDDRFYYGGTWSRVGPENQPIDVCASFERYADDSGYDHSFEFALKAHFPSEWLAHQLHLRWSGCRADFVDKSGSVVAFDPSVKSAGPSVLLVDKLRLRRALARSGYTIVWLYEGYKSVLLASHERGPRPKHRYVMGVYTLGPKGLEGAWKSAIVSL